MPKKEIDVNDTAALAKELVRLCRKADMDIETIEEMPALREMYAKKLGIPIERMPDVVSLAKKGSPITRERKPPLHDWWKGRSPRYPNLDKI